jgi:hypothetical protein
MAEILDPDSKMTLERLAQKEKQPISKVSILFGMITSATFSKKCLIERRSKSRTNDSDSATGQFASPIQSEDRCVPMKAAERNSRSPEGRAIDESGQRPKTPMPIERSLESDSKATVERDKQKPKHHSPSLSTDAGMYMDESARQE